MDFEAFLRRDEAEAKQCEVFEDVEPEVHSDQKPVSGGKGEPLVEILFCPTR